MVVPGMRIVVMTGRMVPIAASETGKGRDNRFVRDQEMLCC